MGFTSSESAINQSMANGSTASGSTVGIDSMLQLEFGTVLLPPLRSEAFVSQRHEVNPALALNLLNDIQIAVTTWQAQLRQIVQAMHLLYAQGPMVDGWLESSLTESKLAESKAAGASSAIFRHGDADVLMQYVEALETVSPDTVSPDTVSPDTVSGDGRSASGAAQYRLCSLDEMGNVRSQPCAPEQMATVSTAIARYQKFKQLIDQKQRLEAKLQQAVDELTSVRTVLTLPPASA
jgi:hypothetical protein